jgi:hypothetical protein
VRVTWHTDGSKTYEGIAQGQMEITRKNLSYCLMQHNIVFQAELYAIRHVQWRTKTKATKVRIHMRWEGHVA